MSLTLVQPIALLALLALTTTACGPNHIAARAPQITFAEMNHGDGQANIKRLSQPPYVVAFKAGEQIPFSFAVESKLFEAKIPPLNLVVKRDFYLLFRKSGAPLLSEDGVDFQSRAKNGFMFGFQLKKGEPTKVVSKISVRAE